MKRIISILIVFLTAPCINLVAQPGNFNIIYTDPTGSNFFPKQMLTTSDGGFIICGYEQYQFSGASVDAMFRKFNIQGNLEWSLRAGSPGYDRAEGIIQAPDGSYYSINSNNTLNSQYMDFCLVHISSSGIPLDFTNYSYFDTTSQHYDYASGISLNQDGTFISTGYTRENGTSAQPYSSFVMKIDQGSNIIWCTLTADPTMGPNYFMNQFVTSDKIYAGGSSGSTPNRDILIASYDQSGNNIFIHKTGTQGDDFAYDIKPTPDGGAILAGLSDSTSTYSYDNMVLKIDSLGNVDWSIVFGTPYNDLLNKVTVLPDSSYIGVGYSYLNGTDSVATIYHITKSGIVDWSKYYSHSTGSLIGTSVIHSTNDSSYFISGRHFNQNSGTTSLFLSHFSETDTACSFIPFSIVTAVPALHTYTFSTFSNPVFIPTIPIFVSYFLPFYPMTDLCLTSGIENIESNYDINLFPNPVTENLIIQYNSLRKITKVELCSVTGNKLLSKSIQHPGEINIDVSGLNNGMYFILITSEDEIFRKIFHKM